MAQMAAQEIPARATVNLGIGIPRSSPTISSVTTWWYTAKMVSGNGSFSFYEDVDPQIINAGKQTVTIVPAEALWFCHEFCDDSGGHVDLAILGGMQVAENGDLANWSVQKTSHRYGWRYGPREWR